MVEPGKTGHRFGSARPGGAKPYNAGVAAAGAQLALQKGTDGDRPTLRRVGLYRRGPARMPSSAHARYSAAGFRACTSRKGLNIVAACIEVGEHAVGVKVHIHVIVKTGGMKSAVAICCPSSVMCECNV